MLPFILAMIGIGIAQKSSLGEIFIAPVTDRIDVVIGNLQTVPTQQSIDNEAWSQLRALMIKKEGRRNDVYRDSLGKLTVGIGHLVLPSDKLKLGDVISNERVEQLFIQDLTAAFNMAKKQAKELGRYNPQMIVALTNVCFQSGLWWNLVHRRAWAALKKGDGQTASKILSSSLWAKQTPTRVADFIGVIQTQFA